MFDKFCKKYLPVYFKIGSYHLSIRSAPIRYIDRKNLSARMDTAWEALRIIIRHNTRTIFVIKRGRDNV